MTDGFSQERRGLFDGLRVPHSLGGLVISFAGVGAFLLAILAIEAICDVKGEPLRLVRGMLGNATSQLGYAGHVVARMGGWGNQWTRYDPVTWFLFFLALTTVWALVSTSVQRIVAHGIAREEGIPIGEAVRFGWKKFVPTFLSVALVALLAGIFWVFVNATLAGQLADTFGGFGNVVLGLLFPLVLVSTFLVVFLTLLGLFGFNLSSAVIATEDADTFEGLSRSWNYLLARPWQVLIAYLAQGLYLLLVMAAGTWFLHASLRSLSIGEWGMGVEPYPVQLDDASRAELGDRLPKGTKLDIAFLPGKRTWLEQFVFSQTPADQRGKLTVNQGVELALEQFRLDVGDYPTEEEGLRALVEDPRGFVTDETRRQALAGWRHPYLRALPTLKGQVPVYVRDPAVVAPPHPYEMRLPGPDGKIKTPDDESLVGVGVGLGPPLDVAPLQGWTLQFTGWLAWFWIRFAQLLLVAYSLYYLLAAQCTTYFFLRHDLEGDAYDEITLEEEEEDAETSADLGQVWRPEGDHDDDRRAAGFAARERRRTAGDTARREGKPLPTVEPPKT